MHVGCTQSILIWPDYHQAVQGAGLQVPPWDKALWLAWWRCAGAQWIEVLCSGLVPDRAEAQLLTITP